MDMSELATKVLFFSGVLINWVVEKSDELGLGFEERQIAIIFFVIDALLIWAVVKWIVYPLPKLIITCILLWVMIGFFAP